MAKNLSTYELKGDAHKIFLSPFYPSLLYAGKHHLHLYHLKKCLPLNSISIHPEQNEVPHLSLYQNKIIYSLGHYVFMNNKKLTYHKNSINKLLCDEYGLILSASADASVCLSSGLKGEKVGELSPHLGGVTAMSWHRSLCISGDSIGEVYLWDINKCKTVFQRKVHSQQVNFIGHYVDYSHNNLYFSVSKNEKRIVFSDLRTNQKVHITNGLPTEIKNVLPNQSGKVFVNNSHDIYLLDICSHFKIVNVFKPDAPKTTKHLSNRKIEDQLILGRYYIAGCSNGCVEVYNSDLQERQHAFSVKEEGIRGLGLSEGKEIMILGADGEVMQLEL